MQLSNDKIISSFYATDYDVLLKCKVKNVGGNYLILKIDQIQGFPQSEVVVLKENVTKLNFPKKAMIGEIPRLNGSPHAALNIVSLANVGVVRQFNDDGSIQSSQWLQDLNEVIFKNEDK